MKRLLPLLLCLVLSACGGLVALLPPTALVPNVNCAPSERSDVRACTVSAIRETMIGRYVRGKTTGFAIWLAGFDADRAAIVHAPDDNAYRLALWTAIERLGDGHTGYATPEAARAQDELFQGRFPFPGAGIMPVRVPEGVLVGGVLPGSPAETAGLRRGDVVVAVDGKPCTTRCAPALRTAKSVGWLRGGQAMAAPITPRHNQGFFPPIASRQGDVAILSIPHFLSPVLDREIDAALGALSNPTPPKALIIDVRSDPGGLILAMKHLLSRVLPPGRYGQTVDRDGEVRPFEVPDIPGGPDWAKTVPLAVLVDSRTRSAGELTAAILQKAGRAIIAGTPTPGETETVWAFDLPDGGRIALSVADYFRTGETRPLSVQGTQPDLALPDNWYARPGDPWIAQTARRLLGR